MEVQNDKKWFIYLLDHHEGPFSSDDIVSMIREGRATSAHYVWRDGMTDWEVLSSLSDFQGRLEPTLGGVNPRFAQGTGASSVGPVETQSTAPEPEPVLAVQNAVQNEPTVIAPMSQAPAPAATLSDEGQFSLEPVAPAIAVDTILSSDVGVDTPAVPPSLPPELTTATLGGEAAPVLEVQQAGRAPAKRSLRERFAPLKRFMKVGLWGLGAILLGGFIFAMTPVGQKLLSPKITGPLAPMTSAVQSFVGSFFSPIPMELKISGSDRRELESAARAPLDREVRVSLALDSEDPTAPLFHVAGNLPDGTVVTVYIEGLGETLLNYFDYASLNRLVLKNKMARTGRLTLADGKALPKGMYRVFAFVPSTQNPEISRLLEGRADVSAAVKKVADHKPKAVVEKTLFLGGPEDEVYRSRLNEFHQRVREKASKEVMELRQFLQALQSQSDLSLARYTTLTKGVKTKVQLADWRKFRTQWTQFSDTMNRQFKAWSDQGYQDVYYAELYSGMRELGGFVVALHEAQNAYFDGPDRVLSIERKIKVNEALNQVDAAFDRMKKDLEFVGDPSALANGLPRRPERRN